MAEPKNDSLKSFDAYADRNGQDMGQDQPNEVANPADLQRRMKSEASGEAEQARLASGQTLDDATDATEAEVPAETIRHLSDASLGGTK